MKKEVRAILDRVPDLYYEQYVPSGYGKSGLDFNGCVRGHAFYIEAKKPDGDLRPRQRQAVVKMLAAGATVFAISDEAGLDSLLGWLGRVCGVRLLS